MRPAILAPLLLAVLLPELALAAAPVPARSAAPHRAARAGAAPATARPAVGALATEARTREDLGAYGLAVQRLRELRGRTKPDPDLEIALALDEARTGLADSAWARLSGPLLAAAMTDTGGPERWHDYEFQREPLWLNGRFDGWNWYVARARAELALAMRRWPEAVAAARVAVAARPVAGKEHLLLAIAAGRAGDGATARREAALAVRLDPLLPEAHYLNGLWAWRDGRRTDARAEFRAAIGCDSSYRPPALGLVRLRLPAARPDSLPVAFLTGVRRVALLTSAERPKLEEPATNDQPPALYGSQPQMTVPDSLKAVMRMTRPVHMYVTVLADERGRPVLDDLPWLSPEYTPVELIEQILAVVRTWRFRPAVKLGHPQRAWATVELDLNP